jgi:hypothetical protein
VLAILVLITNVAAAEINNFFMMVPVEFGF